MKFRWEKKYLYGGITALIVCILSLCFYYLLFHGNNLWSGFHAIVRITMPIIDGFVLAYLLTPLLNHIEKKILVPLCRVCRIETGDKGQRRMRKLSILLTMIVVVFILYCFFSILIPELIKSIQSIVFQFPVYINNLNNWLMDIFENNPDLEEMAAGLLTNYSAEVESWLTRNLLPQANSLLKVVSTGLIGSVIGLAKAAWNLLIGFIISIYLLDGKERFAGQGKKVFYACMDTETANIFVSNVRFIHKTFIGFIGGKIIDSIIIGIICFVGTNLMGTPYAMLISVIIGVTNVIPFFGPYIGAIPSAVLILMVDPLQCLYFIIFIFILQQFDGNILGPKILGDSTGLTSFWVIFSITLFGGLWGVIGMIVGVPLFAVFYAGVKAVIDRRLSNKNLPSDTEVYLKVGSIRENREFVNYAPISKKEKKASKGRIRESGDSWELFKQKKQLAAGENTTAEKKAADFGREEEQERKEMDRE